MSEQSPPAASAESDPVTSGPASPWVLVFVGALIAGVGTLGWVGAGPDTSESSLWPAYGLVGLGVVVAFAGLIGVAVLVALVRLDWRREQRSAGEATEESVGR